MLVDVGFPPWVDFGIFWALPGGSILIDSGLPRGFDFGRLLAFTGGSGGKVFQHVRETLHGSPVSFESILKLEGPWELPLTSSVEHR